MKIVLPYINTIVCKNVIELSCKFKFLIYEKTALLRPQPAHPTHYYLSEKKPFLCFYFLK